MVHSQKTQDSRSSYCSISLTLPVLIKISMGQPAGSTKLDNTGKSMTWPEDYNASLKLR